MIIEGRATRPAIVTWSVFALFSTLGAVISFFLSDVCTLQISIFLSFFSIFLISMMMIGFLKSTTIIVDDETLTIIEWKNKKEIIEWNDIIEIGTIRHDSWKGSKLSRTKGIKTNNFMKYYCLSRAFLGIYIKLKEKTIFLNNEEHFESKVLVLLFKRLVEHAEKKKIQVNDYLAIELYRSFYHD